MTGDPKHTWDADLAGLLAVERENVSAPDGSDARVWGNVAKDLGLGGQGPDGSGGGGPASSARTISGAVPARRLRSPTATMGVYALGVVTGIVGSVLVMRANAPPSNAGLTETMHVDREVAPPAVTARLNATADAEIPMRASPVAVVAAPVRVAPSAEHTLEGERVLLDEARAALGRGDGAAALHATELHAGRYPQGFLTEEREAIAIQALLLVPRYDDARQREAAFERQYPHSMLLQAVRASVQSIP